MNKRFLCSEGALREELPLLTIWLSASLKLAWLQPARLLLRIYSTFVFLELCSLSEVSQPSVWMKKKKKNYLWDLNKRDRRSWGGISYLSSHSQLILLTLGKRAGKLNWTNPKPELRTERFCAEVRCETDHLRSRKYEGPDRGIRVEMRSVKNSSGNCSWTLPSKE